MKYYYITMEYLKKIHNERLFGIYDTRRCFVISTTAAAIIAGASLAASAAGTAYSAAQQKKAQEAGYASVAEAKAAASAEHKNKKYVSEAETRRGQNILRIAKDAAREAWKRESGAAAMGGATAEQAALAKEAGNKMVGDALGKISEQDTARQDAADQQYHNDMNSIRQQELALKQQEYASRGALGQAIGNTAAQAGMTAVALAGEGGQGTQTPETPASVRPVNQAKMNEFKSNIAEDIAKMPSAMDELHARMTKKMQEWEAQAKNGIGPYKNLFNNRS